MDAKSQSTSSGQEVRPFANLMMDVAFKIAFGKELGKQNMIDLLECLLPGKHITQLEYVDKEHPGFFVSEKRSIFDLQCKSGDESFVVEMQVKKKSFFKDRVLFYSSFLLRDQLLTPLEEIKALTEGRKKEIKDYHLKPVYMVSIVDYALDHQDDAALEQGLVSRYSLRNEQADEQMSDALHFVFYEIGRMKYKPNEAKKCKGILEKVAFIFRNGSKLTGIPAEFEDDITNRLLNTMEKERFTPEERRRYELELLEDLEKNSELEAAREEGLEKGIEKGIEKERITIARNLKSAGIPPETIAQATGLTLEQVKAL